MSAGKVLVRVTPRWLYFQAPPDRGDDDEDSLGLSADAGGLRGRRGVLDEQDDLEQLVRESEVLEELERGGGEFGEGDQDSFTIESSSYVAAN